MEVDVLHQLAAILEQRKSADPSTSYVAKLYAGGMDLIRKKIGEEATEVVIAAGNEDNAALIHEVADLWFHSLVALSARNLGHEAVLAELGRRFGVSGIEEKASRRGQ